MSNAARIRPTLFCFAILLAALFQPAVSGAAPESVPLKVRGDNNYPPYEFLDHGVPSGFNVDLFKAVAAAMGLEYEISLGPWNVVRTQLEEGEIDVLMGMYSSPERDKTVDFSTPHIIVSHSLFVRDDSDTENLDDMVGRDVIVQEGDIMHDYILEHGGPRHVILVPDQVKGLEMLSSGKHDMALMAKLQGMFTAHRLGLGNIRPTGPPVLPRNYCFAVPEGRTKLIAQINEGLKIIHETGEYHAVYDKWFGVADKRMTWEDMLRYAFLIAAPLAALLGLAFVWTWTLRRTVRARTRELEESEQRFQTVVELAHVPMSLTSTDGMVVHVNKAFIKTFGYTLQDIPRVEDWWPRAYPDPDVRKKAYDEWLENLKRAEKGELPCRAAVRPVTCMDGTIKQIEFQYSPIRNLWLTTFHDLTEKIRLEEVMIQSEKMISVGGLAAGMAHEINNPLAGILQSVEVLKVRLSPDRSKNLKAAEQAGLDMDTLRVYMELRRIPGLLENIRESGARAAHIVEDMLSFSRLSEEKTEFIDPAALLDRSLELASKDFSLKKDFDFRKIEIIRNYDSAIPPVPCRPNKIQQVLLNLLANGAHAMAEQTDPGPMFTLSVRTRNNMAEICIEDNGRGMDEHTRKRIFDPFFTTKPEGVGTGLGLSIAYFIIVNQHCGELRVRSGQDKGTTFTIRLPLEECCADIADRYKNTS